MTVQKPSSPAKSVARKLNLNPADQLDQFYTDPDVAQKLVRFLRGHFDLNKYQCVEPSAGTGSFLQWLPRSTLAYDIDPKAAGIVKADFLKTRAPSSRSIAVIGNPPFGTCCNQAVKFFNRAAEFADIIAFIVPRTFEKVWLQNRLDLSFRLVNQDKVPKNAFIFEGAKKDVPTVFQIWQRQPFERELEILPTTHPDFYFVSDSRQASFAIQRVGQNAGSVHFDFGKSSSSHYFISPRIPGVLPIMSMLDLQAEARKTAGNPSLAKTEIVKLYSRFCTGLLA